MRALNAARYTWGVIIILAVILPVFSHAEDATENATPRKALSAIRPNDRYVVVEISRIRDDQYMLDTQTGQLWSLTVSKVPNPSGGNVESNVKAMVLVPVPYLRADGKAIMTPK
jgi:hypothetical protein